MPSVSDQEGSVEVSEQNDPPSHTASVRGFPGTSATFGAWRGRLSQAQLEEAAGLDDEGTSADESGRSDSSVFSGEFEACGVPVLGGLREWHPDLYRWLVSGMGTPTRVLMVVLFIAVDAGRFWQAEDAYVEEVNIFSFLVVTNVCSLCIGLFVTLFVEGSWGARKVFTWHPVWRFAAITVLFTCATSMTIQGYRLGVPSVDVAVLGFTYLPISAWLSMGVYRREYGRLEWLAMGMIVLSAACFTILRERKKVPVGEHFSVVEGVSAMGLGAVIVAIVLSATASIFAERIFKDKSRGLIRHRGVRNDRFYITKVHLDFGELSVSLVLWGISILRHGHVLGFHTKVWFGSWSRHTAIMVAISVAQSWLAGLVAKHFSTVVKSLAQTIATIIALMLSDEILRRYNISEREVPSLMLAVIVALSALIFQTGRLNLSAINRVRKASGRPEQEPQTITEIFRGLACIEPKKPAAVSALETDSDWSAAALPPTSSGKAAGVAAKLARYSWMLLYILADAARNLLNARANRTPITPQSMPLMTFLCGVGLFSGIMLCSKGLGLSGLRETWRPGKIIKCLPCGFFFALSTALLSMAFSQGVTASMNMILGKVYTPMAALASRWVLGKFYIWLEWFALIITTLASGTFGYLQTMEAPQGTPKAPIFPLFLVVGSALSSVLGSLTVERILKGEDVPFIISKVRLDIASLVWSLALLPVLGVVSHISAPLGNSRQQDAFWTDRPLGFCGDPNCFGRLGSNSTCASELCSCVCGHGVLVAWDALGPPGISPSLQQVRAPIVILALAANVFQGWLSAMVAYQFSTVQRAIADSFSLLLVYFVGDPLLNGASISDPALNLVAFIVPLSAAAFMVAARELQKLLELAGLDIGRPRRRHEHEHTEPLAPANDNPSLDDASDTDTASDS